MNQRQQPDYFKLFSCCKIVKGFARSIIYDLQRKEYHFIPNSLYEILFLYKEKSIPEIKNGYDAESQAIIDSFFQYLFDKELAFPCQYEDLSQFPEMNNANRETPCLLESFMVDIDEKSNHDYVKIIEPLSQLALKAIQLRCFDRMDIVFIHEIMDLIKKSDIRTVEWFIPYNRDIHPEDWEKLIHEHMKITSITIYNAKEPDICYIQQATLIHKQENITSCEDCGKISKNVFTCNLHLYTESQQYNTCLNGKASVDVSGQIRNCPSMPVGFGHYRDVSLIETVKKPVFQQLWKIRKDDINVCRDCEFRYMCTDCRAYIKDKSNILSQPEKCRYNPYIAKWEGEEGYCAINAGANNQI
ncbi:MAG: grasp-with-spasm system SPASM domain peptide maturase [Prevotellaceae bacterium]|jgi:SPASM domain peptide maturase of grasp-with-spasm system|nr:grasp-with-spasm system SPASM domain peptide maturase [Prevotellaceae bacterium]